jgi:hypothetical protein
MANEYKDSTDKASCSRLRSTLESLLKILAFQPVTKLQRKTKDSYNFMLNNITSMVTHGDQLSETFYCVTRDEFSKNVTRLIREEMQDNAEEDVYQ